MSAVRPIGAGPSGGVGKKLLSAARNHIHARWRFAVSRFQERQRDYRPNRASWAIALGHTRWPEPWCRFVEASQTGVVLDLVHGRFNVRQFRYPTWPARVDVPENGHGGEK